MKRFLWLMMVAANIAFAAEPVVQPGDYLTERGWGNLSIVQDKKGGLKFSIEAMGGNAHSCSLNGEIRDGRATLEAMDPGKPCVVTFKREADGVAVASFDPQLCRYFCGMRADFEGKYLKTAAGCTPKPLARTREEYTRLYDRKDYTAARAKLEPAFNDCAKTLDWLETGWMRNDLALTQFRLGDAAGCLRTLEPLAKDAAKSDAQIRDEMVAPTDVDNWLPVVKAARTNLKLCRTAAK